MKSLTNSSETIIPLPVNEVVTQITETVSGEHNILVYSDAELFGKIYSEYCKKHLAENDIVILLTFYETSEKVKLSLGNAGIDIEQSFNEGSLIIADAAKEIFGENKNLLQFLLNAERHIKRVGKGCVSVIVSMGPFFLYEKEEEILEYEGLLDLCKVRNWKVLCCYHREDVQRLSEAQMQRLLDRHNKKLLSAYKKLLNSVKYLYVKTVLLYLQSISCCLLMICILGGCIPAIGSLKIGKETLIVQIPARSIHYFACRRSENSFIYSLINEAMYERLLILSQMLYTIATLLILPRSLLIY